MEAMGMGILKKGEGRTVKNGGLWVYNNEFQEVIPPTENGGLLLLKDFDGYPLGIGFYNNRSKIALRLLTRDEEAVIDEKFWRTRVRRALAYRRHVTDMESCRLLFGEADGFPGLTVDKYGTMLVVQSLALGIDRCKETILRILREELAAAGFAVDGIYERSDVSVRLKEGLPLQKGFLWFSGEEEPSTLVTVRENGISYQVDVKEGQKTGFFLDQRENRMAVRRLCEGGGVLDCFTHTGSFALNAAAGGAREVLGIDASETAIAQARQNATLNHMEGEVSFLCADVFALLPELVRQGKQYDVVILDPPAFTKSSHSVKQALRGYRQINLWGMLLVREGGFLVTCSCSHFVTPELFAKTIFQAARAAHRNLRQVEYRTQAPDHPVFWGAENSSYLKYFSFEVSRTF